MKSYYDRFLDLYPQETIRRQDYFWTARRAGAWRDAYKQLTLLREVDSDAFGGPAGLEWYRAEAKAKAKQ